jgi:hypothetical protein
MPKLENISLAIFTLIEPNWVGGLGAGGKNRFFCQFTPDFDCFWLFAAY